MTVFNGETNALEISVYSTSNGTTNYVWIAGGGSIECFGVPAQLGRMPAAVDRFGDVSFYYCLWGVPTNVQGIVVTDCNLVDVFVQGFCEGLIMQGLLFALILVKRGIRVVHPGSE